MLAVEDVLPVFQLFMAYVAMAGFTFMARWEDTGNHTNALAAGVLWPIYLPYRLALMIWKGEV